MSGCNSSPDQPLPQWFMDGGFAPVVLGVIAMFWGITFVCEEYGVPSITAFCKRNSISDALAGSIFIGTGLSLPVFFVALVGLFVSNSAIGVGAVVGGNLFNHLVTIGSTIYVCPDRTMKLDAVIYTREMLLYFLSCLLLIWVVSDGNMHAAFATAFDPTQWRSCVTISWGCSLSLVVAFIMYCLFDANFHLVEGWIRKFLPTPAGGPLTAVESQTSDLDDVEGGVAIVSISGLEPVPIDLGAENSSTRSLEVSAKVVQVKIKSMLESTLDETDGYQKMFDVPEALPNRLLFALTLPMRALIYFTIPDVRRPGSESRALLSTAMTIAWLALQSYVLTVCLTLLGQWSNIHSAIMGITVAAWASNFPAHWSSMIVSRHGFGDVSVCNCLGSNVFNNLIGLGLPWLLYNLAHGNAPYNALEDDGVVISILVMMGVIAIQYAMLALSKWTLTEWMAPVMIALYAASIGYLCYMLSSIK